MEVNKIYNMDCLEGMELIPDGSIDMILTDLPYGTTKNKWDNVIPFEPMWEQYERIIKDNGAIVLTAQPPFDKVLSCSNLKLFRYEWIWEKTNATGHLNAKKMPLKAHENILVFYKKLPVYNPQKTQGHPRKTSTRKRKLSGNYGEYKPTSYDSTERYPRSVLRFASDKQVSNLVPTQKPVALFEYLIRTYTNENALICDSCIGSGTTAVATLRAGENRKFIGFEKDKETCREANERVKNEMS
jgi:site-specific DNA-methyltransferase (adenine-specific)